MVKNNCTANYLKVTMGILLIVIFKIENVKAQNAEDLFKNHHKWGITGQYNIFSEADITPTNNNRINYEIFKNKRFAIGLDYNFYQHRKWNFKVGLQLQWFGNDAGYTILEEENITPFNIGNFYRTEHDRILHLPFGVEYVFLKRGKFFISFGGGAGISYYQFDAVTFDSSINDVPIFISNYENSKSPFYSSGHLETSIYFKRKSFMFQASLIYNKSFKSYRKGNYEFLNLEISPDTKGEIDQSGDFMGVSLTVYLKKRSTK